MKVHIADDSSVCSEIALESAPINTRECSPQPSPTSVAVTPTSSDPAVSNAGVSKLVVVRDRHFRFPLRGLITVKHISRSCQESEFSDVKYLCAGSNSFVYSAMRNNEPVVVKMLKNKLAHPQVAEYEMCVESHILTKLKHPNVVNIKAAGRLPRPFIVLEHLEGGTLATLLEAKNKSIMGLTTITTTTKLSLISALKISQQLICGLKYLHEDLCPHATVIHRDLKPMNIGFTAEKTLKLFDLGLATCVRKSTKCDQTYNMTGYTGTRVYMAPEVAKRQPYNEKVDIYSFAIILWQLLTGEVPFRGMSKEEHLEKIIHGGLRPPLVNSDNEPFPNLSADLVDLLERCWNADPRLRPSCGAILKILDTQIAIACSPRAVIYRASMSLMSLTTKQIPKIIARSKSFFIHNKVAPAMGSSTTSIEAVAVAVCPLPSSIELLNPLPCAASEEEEEEVDRQ